MRLAEWDELEDDDRDDNFDDFGEDEEAGFE